MRRGAAIGLAAALCACATSAPEYQHNRWDYWSFRARVGALPEPNYLPWAMHPEKLADGEALVACRFADDAFPLAYFVHAPEIPESLAGEWSARDAADYVTAVDEAFAAWERAIGRPVRFRRVASPAEAELEVRLRAEVEEIQSGQLLGVMHDARTQCEVTEDAGVHDRVTIRFAPRAVSLYVADSVGLLTPRQVRAVALHELGHVLGVSGQHSPLAGDVMYAVAGDRRIEALSEHDRATLRALYRVPPGMVYARLAERHAEPPSQVRRQPPKLADETKDARNGFTVRFPVNWQVLRTPSGWIAVDGVSWDYDASIQLVAVRGTPDRHLSLLGGQGMARGDDVRVEVFELDGEQVVRLLIRGNERAEETDVFAWRDGWSLILIADARARDFLFYQPWFQRVLLSIDRYSGEAEAEAR